MLILKNIKVILLAPIEVLLELDDIFQDVGAYLQEIERYLRDNNNEPNIEGAGFYMKEIDQFIIDLLEIPKRKKKILCVSQSFHDRYQVNNICKGFNVNLEI